MGNIINAIWNSPWYQVLIIAIVDDIILFLKLWWLWGGCIALCFILAAYNWRK